MKTKLKLSFSPAFFICWGAAVLLEPNIWLACIAASMALHEAGHLIFIALLGGGVREVRFCAAGMEIVRAPGLRSYRADMLVSLAGPLFSFIGACALLHECKLFRFFGASSLMLGVLNLLPICSLDGGEALFSLLCRICSPERALKTVRGISFIFIVVLWMLAVWILLITGGNFSLFVMSVFLFVSLAFGV